MNLASHSLPLIGLQTCRALQLYLTESDAKYYVLSCFRNLKKLSLVSTGEGLLHFDSVIRQRMMTRWELLCWGV